MKKRLGKKLQSQNIIHYWTEEVEWFEEKTVQT